MGSPTHTLHGRTCQARILQEYTFVQNYPSSSPSNVFQTRSRGSTGLEQYLIVIRVFTPPLWKQPQGYFIIHLGMFLLAYSFQIVYLRMSSTLESVSAIPQMYFSSLAVRQEHPAPRQCFSNKCTSNSVLALP